MSSCHGLSLCVVGGNEDDVKVYKVHTPFNPMSTSASSDYQNQPSTGECDAGHERWRRSISCSLSEPFFPSHVTLDSSHDVSQQEQVRELRVGAGTLSRHGHLPQLPRASAHQRHLQSGNIRLAHVPPLHPVRVGPRKPSFLFICLFIYKDLTW